MRDRIAKGMSWLRKLPAYFQMRRDDRRRQRKIAKEDPDAIWDSRLNELELFSESGAEQWDRED
jgi:hypothetical protein